MYVPLDPVISASTALACPALGPMPGPRFVFPDLAIWQWLAIAAFLALLIWMGAYVCRLYLRTRAARRWGMALICGSICCLVVAAYLMLPVHSAWRADMVIWHMNQLANIHGIQPDCYHAVDRAYDQAILYPDGIAVVGDSILLPLSLLLWLPFALVGRRKRVRRAAI